MIILILKFYVFRIYHFLEKMEEIPEFNPMDFTILKKIGKGSFGSVKLVENVKTHKQYAAKEQNEGSDNSFQKEFQAYMKVQIMLLFYPC